MIEGLQGLMQKQTEEFQNLMKSMGRHLEKKKKPLAS
jgi:hypothetical protein